MKPSKVREMGTEELKTKERELSERFLRFAGDPSPCGYGP
jgi:ribosomal protein L29